MDALKPARTGLKLFTATLLAGLLATAGAQPSLPKGFKTQTLKLPDGAQIFVRSGGSGPAVVSRHDAVGRRSG